MVVLNVGGLGNTGGAGLLTDSLDGLQDAPKHWRGKFLKYKEHKKHIKAYKDGCVRPPDILCRHSSCA